MIGQDDALGGRLPLPAPDSMPPAQKAVYDRVSSTLVPWADRSGFKSRTRDGRLIGPFNSLLFSPEVTPGLLDFCDAEEEHSTLSERERRVIVLTVGAVWQAAYEIYAQSALARAAGIPEAAIAALARGELPDGLSERESLAQRYTYKIITEHKVDAALFDAAEKAFGRTGLVDIAYKVGRYLLVSFLLTSFEVPAPE